MSRKSKTVTISQREYDQLIEDQVFLRCLETAGVDNWEGYQSAVDLYDADLKREEEAQ